MKRNTLLWICIILLLSACLPIKPQSKTPIPIPTGISTLNATGNPTTTVEVTSAIFTLAAEYGIFGAAKVYGDAGISAVKLQPVFGMWGNLEPEKGKFNWAPLDALILQYQKVGVSELQLLISAESPWASRLTDPTGDPFPKEEALADYGNFVTKLVERYDADGIDDMPGLLFPINEFGIEREYTGFWKGTAEEYVRLLQIASPAIKSANPNARILLVALLMTDIFTGNPTPAQVEQRINATKIGKSLADTLEILKQCDYYDIVDFHSLGDYKEIPQTAAWIRKQLASFGCDKPIWIGDSFSMSGLVGYLFSTFSPATESNRDQVIKLLQAVADPQSSDHLTVQSWLYDLMAVGIVRKATVSAGEGLIGINLGNMEDWNTGAVKLDQAAVAAVGTSLFMGMTDTKRTLQAPGGLLGYQGKDWSYSRNIGNKRSPFFALELTNRMFNGFIKIEKIDLGKDVWAYRMERTQGPLWIIWTDDNGLRFPGVAASTIPVELSINAVKIKITSTPLSADQGQVQEKEFSVTGNQISLQISDVPVFIEAIP